jgi:hypothetical protein
MDSTFNLESIYGDQRVPYSDEVAAKICKAAASGKTITDISKEEWSPARSTIYYWQSSHPEFAQQLSIALRIRAKIWIDELCDEFRDCETEAVDDCGEYGSKTVNLSARVALLDKKSGWLRWHAEKVGRDSSINDDFMHVTLSDGAPSDQLAEITQLVARGELGLAQAERLTALLARAVECVEIKELKVLLEQQIKINEAQNAKNGFEPSAY